MQQQPPLMSVRIPVVARNVLVVPRQFPCIGIQDDGGIAVEIRRGMCRDRIGVPVVAYAPRVLGGVLAARIRDAPVEQTPYGVVGSRQSPRRRLSFLER